MRKVIGLVAAAGLTVALVAGCGAPSQDTMVNKLKTETQTLSQQNYTSTAMMTVQTDNSSQTYYIQTNYEGPNQYRIELGDSNKNVNQIIVKNNNGMYIVSPSLQKVFRFNGDWAQNQGHIYLYDQILQQVIQSASQKQAKMTEANGTYTFELPITPANDVVAKEKVEINSKTMKPTQVVLYDKQGTAVVLIKFTSFQTGVKFQNADFDPYKLASSGTAKTTAVSQSEFGYVLPTTTFQDKLDVAEPMAQNDYLLRYTGPDGFTLSEFRPGPGADGLPNASLVDLYGVPALETTAGKTHQLMWLQNGVEFSLTSSSLSPAEMDAVAISTFGQIGK